uniref:Uncharacterized protein n=1 Tax=Arundo donax TaxID=35708 RepID=A0A0A9BNA0_ARUDO
MTSSKICCHFFKHSILVSVCNHIFCQLILFHATPKGP